MSARETDPAATRPAAVPLWLIRALLSMQAKQAEAAQEMQRAIASIIERFSMAASGTAEDTVPWQPASLTETTSVEDLVSAASTMGEEYVSIRVPTPSQSSFSPKLPSDAALPAPRASHARKPHVNQAQNDKARSKSMTNQCSTVEEGSEAVQFKPTAFMTIHADLIYPDLILDTTMDVGEARDASVAEDGARRIEIRDLALEYPDGSYTTYFPVPDVIIKYRSTMMASAASKALDGLSSVSSGYGVTCVSLGIPELVMQVIWRNIMWRLRRAQDQHCEKDAPTSTIVDSGDGRSDICKVQFNDGYYWLIANVPSALPGTVKIDKEYTPIPSVCSLVKSLRQNLRGDAILTTRLERIGERERIVDEPWILNVRIAGMVPIGAARETSQAINATTKTSRRKVEAGSSVVVAFRPIHNE